MAVYGLGSAWSKASENQAVNQFAAASAARDRSLSDEYHRAKAHENLMRLHDEGRVDMNSREANAYLENDYLRSKTDGAAGLGKAQFDQYALQGTGLTDEAKAVASGLPLKNYTQGAYDVSQHATRNEAGELGIGDKSELSMDYRKTKLQAERDAQALKKKAAGGDGLGEVGFTGKETISKADEGLMKSLDNAATPSQTLEEKVSKAKTFTEELGMDDDDAAKFIAKVYAKDNVSKADIIGYIASSGLAKNEQEYDALMEKIGATNKKTYELKRDGKLLPSMNGFTADGIDYGIYNSPDGNTHVVDMNQFTDIMTKSGGTATDISKANVSSIGTEMSTFANTDDVENFNSLILTPGEPAVSLFNKEELNDPYMKEVVGQYGKLRDEVFDNGAYQIMSNIQNVEGLTSWFGVDVNELKDGMKKHIIDGSIKNPETGKLKTGQQILLNVATELETELNDDPVYQNEDNDITRNYIYKELFTNRVRKAVLEANLNNPKNKFFKEQRTKSQNIIKDLTQSKVLPKDAVLSTGNSVVYKSNQFNPYKIKAVITNKKTGKRTIKNIDLRTKEHMRKSVNDFYKTLYADKGKGHTQYKMNILDDSGWPEGMLEEKYKKKDR